MATSAFLVEIKYPDGLKINYQPAIADRIRDAIVAAWSQYQPSTDLPRINIQWQLSHNPDHRFDQFTVAINVIGLNLDPAHISQIGQSLLTNLIVSSLIPPTVGRSRLMVYVNPLPNAVAFTG